MQLTAEPEAKDGELMAIKQLADEALKESVQLFKLLADETRLRILYLLHQAQELNVLELCKLLDQRQPSVSHHLALLRVAGLIEMRRDGKHNYYRVAVKQFQEMIARIVGSDSGNPVRICLDDHELRYGPVDQSAAYESPRA